MGNDVKFSKLLHNEEKTAYNEEHPLEVTGEESPAGGTEPVAGTDEGGDVGILVKETTGTDPDEKIRPPEVGLGEEITKAEEKIRDT